MKKKNSIFLTKSLINVSNITSLTGTQPSSPSYPSQSQLGLGLWQAGVNLGIQIQNNQLKKDSVKLETVLNWQNLLNTINFNNYTQLGKISLSSTNISLIKMISTPFSKSVTPKSSQSQSQLHSCEGLGDIAGDKKKGKILEYNKIIDYKFFPYTSFFYNSKKENNLTLNLGTPLTPSPSYHSCDPSQLWGRDWEGVRDSNCTGTVVKKINNGNKTNIYKLLSLIFRSMYCLISKPVIKTTNDKITIQLFYYLSIPKKKIFRFFYILYINSLKKKWFLKKNNLLENILLNEKKDIFSSIRPKNFYNKYNKNVLANANLKKKNMPIFIKSKLRKAISRLKNNPLKNLLFNLRKFNLTKVFFNKFKLICDILSNKFNKPVELQLIRLHHPYHDSNILVNLLALNFKNKKKKARWAIQKIYNKNAVKNLNDPAITSKNFIPAFLSGLNIKIAGRLMREPIIPRITTKVFEKGSTATGKVNYLDIAKLTKKNKKGAYTIKITSGQNFF